MNPPVAVGGVGGSGTRLVASILREAGMWLGPDLNESMDNLWFTLLFCRADALAWPEREVAARWRIFERAMRGRASGWCGRRRLQRIVEAGLPEYPVAWARERGLRLMHPPRPEGGCWGWKEPNTHMLLPRLLKCAPELRYVHVMRHGVDMAFSDNQNQPRRWGEALPGAAGPPGPRRALRFWCVAHRRLAAVARTMRGRFLAVHYEALCERPETEIARLLEFAGLPADAAGSLERLVKRPAGPPRRERMDAGMLDPADVAYANAICDPEAPPPPDAWDEAAPEARP